MGRLIDVQIKGGKCREREREGESLCLEWEMCNSSKQVGYLDFSLKRVRFPSFYPYLC